MIGIMTKVLKTVSKKIFNIILLFYHINIEYVV